MAWPLFKRTPERGRSCSNSSETGRASATIPLSRGKVNAPGIVQRAETAVELASLREDKVILETGIHEALRNFYAKQVARDDVSEALRGLRLEWRVACFTIARRYASYIEDQYFAISGKRVLDLACGWGGHAMAFASQGATVICSDLTDYRFSDLLRFARDWDVRLVNLRGDCERLPFKENSFDIILALDVVEHIRSVSCLAIEVQRLLRPGGLCLVTSPCRLHSLIFGEPHWGLKGISLLPLRVQRLIATRIFRRTYPFPITRQYTLVAQLLKPFTRVGLTGRPVVVGRLSKMFEYRPILLNFIEQCFWTFVILRKTDN
jgi:2-polyprenyl-3-methyl-5-hydroxy-6-metoxy-1,4-benzoquinol methylase